MQFIARLRELGRQAGRLQACIGHIWEWFAIVKAMLETDITPDFIVVDGAEGGTGAAPVEFADHMGVPRRKACCWCTTRWIGVNLRSASRSAPPARSSTPSTWRA
jgi:glutamate synthase domain-containing protein 2